MKSTSYMDAKLIPQERVEAMARPVLAAVRKAFEDPATAKDYEKWLAARAAKMKGAHA
jgi:hypothetical protein